ncbi:MAG: adenosine kinase [Planctomycetota bacterium]|nr:MAG: adenosine kinase [Planctomycetota bacterium]
MHYDVYGVGNALVDIQVRVPDEVLDELGFAKGVMTLVDEGTQRDVLRRLADLPTYRCAGGSAANTVIGVADFGGRAAYAGKVAADELGTFCLQDMRQMGVVIEVPPAPAGHTGTCVVLITQDAQRTMLTHLGVSSTLAPEDIDPNEVRRSQFVYIEGYLFTEDAPRAAALKAIEYAKNEGVRVAFTVSDPFLIDLYRDEFWELIRGPVDLLFCNEQEARALTGCDDPIECAHVIHRHAPHVALTLGPNGSIIMDEGRAIPIEAVEVDAVDTTGAGDMYAAGLLYGITHGFTRHAAGRLASHAAARIVAQMGARLQRRFTPGELEQILRGGHL